MSVISLNLKWVFLSCGCAGGVIQRNHWRKSSSFSKFRVWALVLTHWKHFWLIETCLSWSEMLISSSSSCPLVYRKPQTQLILSAWTYRGETSGVVVDPHREEILLVCRELYSVGLSGGVFGTTFFFRWNLGEPRKLIRRLLSRARQCWGDRGEVTEVVLVARDSISDRYKLDSRAPSFEFPFPLLVSKWYKWKRVRPQIKSKEVALPECIAVRFRYASSHLKVYIHHKPNSPCLRGRPTICNCWAGFLFKYLINLLFPMLG